MWTSAILTSYNVLSSHRGQRQGQFSSLSNGYPSNGIYNGKRSPEGQNAVGGEDMVSVTLSTSYVTEEKMRMGARKWGYCRRQHQRCSAHVMTSQIQCLRWCTVYVIWHHKVFSTGTASLVLSPGSNSYFSILPFQYIQILSIAICVLMYACILLSIFYVIMLNLLQWYIVCNLGATC